METTVLYYSLDYFSRGIRASSRTWCGVHSSAEPGGPTLHTVNNDESETNCILWLFATMKMLLPVSPDQYRLIFLDCLDVNAW
jgi:hypothetical protein